MNFMKRVGIAAVLATSLSGCQSYGGDVYAWDVGVAGVSGGTAGSLRIAGGSGGCYGSRCGSGWVGGGCTSVYGCGDSYYTSTWVSPCSSPFGCVWQSHGRGCGSRCGSGWWGGSSWGNYGNDFYRKYRPHYTHDDVYGYGGHYGGGSINHLKGKRAEPYNIR